MWFLGLMTYLSQHIPNFEKEAQPLRDLIKKDVPFQWDAIHDRCVSVLKHMVSKSKSLAYYNVSKPVTLEVDASQ